MPRQLKRETVRQHDTQMRELRSQILRELALALTPDGWRLHESIQSLHRVRHRTTEALHVTFVRHRSELDFTLDVAIRFAEVETILNAQRPWLSQREAAATFSVGAELGNITGAGNHQWTVAAAADVPSAAHAALDMFRRVGAPFLERFSSLQEVQRALRAEKAEAALIAPVAEQRRELLAAVSRVLDGRAA